MRSMFIAIVPALLVISLITGCARKKATEDTAPAVTEQTLPTIKQAYEANNPGVKVGLVSAALPENNLVAVTDLNPAEFQQGDALVFIDGDGKILTMGRVVTSVNNALHVRYEAPRVDARAPQAGDLAVRTSDARTPATRPTEAGM